MALVKCPECGREKVSDTAIACPDCGYCIKAHFDNIKKDEEIREQQRLEEINKRNLEETHIENIPRPLKPKKNYLVIGTCLFIISIIAFFTITLLIENNSKRSYDVLHDNSKDNLIIILAFAILGVGTYIFAIIVDKYKKMKKAYLFAERDFETYRKAVVARENKRLAYLQKEYQLRSIIQANNAECPYCHSKNTRKITTIDKAINITKFGVLAQKCKHQWQCNDCKSYF